jgi:phage-related protein
VKDRSAGGPKPVRWVGDSLEELKTFPRDVQRSVGVALWAAQTGGKAPYAKPLKGFGGAAVLEIVDSFHGEAYRADYAVCFSEVVFVLHVFQKKSKRGAATPKGELDKIRQRLKRAESEYEEWRKNANAIPK